MKIFIVVALLAAFGLFLFSSSMGNRCYVSISGNDSLGDGSEKNPWRTIKYALTKVTAGETVEIAEGVFAEDPFIVPPGVNIEGQGKTRTLLKVNPSSYYNPAKPDYSPDKFLVQFSSDMRTSGSQFFRNLMIDGESKRLHGGIHINKRTDLEISDVLIQDTNFTGLWLWDTKDTRIRNVEIKNCSWGSFEWCNGALNIGNVENIEIDNTSIDEDIGYGIKGLGPENSKIKNLVIHHSKVSVNPKGLWNNGTAPNISIELFNTENTVIHHCYVDNHISIAGNNSPNLKSIRIHHNTFDLDNRAKGHGYGIELNADNAEIDHNYFIKGSYGIVNWGALRGNWEIHHNVFYGLESIYPTDMLRSQTNGLHHVNVYNNTIELTSAKTVNLVGVYGGKTTDLSVMNNLVINTSTASEMSVNEVVHIENGATLEKFQISNNFFENVNFGQPKDEIAEGGSQFGIVKTGNKPIPFYQLQKGSKLIDAGRDVGLSFEGKFPDIGAYEYNND